MYVICTKDISVFKTGKCYCTTPNSLYNPVGLCLYHENGCESESDIPERNFGMVERQREELISRLIRDNDMDCPINVALEYSIREYTIGELYSISENDLIDKIEEWSDHWNRQPW